MGRNLSKYYAKKEKKTSLIPVNEKYFYCLIRRLILYEIRKKKHSYAFYMNLSQYLLSSDYI